MVCFAQFCVMQSVKFLSGLQKNCTKSLLFALGSNLNLIHNIMDR